ncbi:mechanosensitive ion channel [Cellulomonas cellasea]|uniref:mechanosensitive ion channel domain-containing protein n=1 Tax=Cellulomonas cellasea TaxID=43670 RepID=UPI0025A3C5B9|nr:mechanosensitive ion channel domain-containing protein [Cellulomonas cellasea]MDM8084472.1 mechanosensitive ion channel [Cellulomonas cellasea]
MTLAFAVDDPSEVVVPALVLVACAVGALLAAAIVSIIARRVARRYAIAADLTRRSRAPLQVTFLLISVWIGIWLSTDPARWTRVVGHALFISLIVSVSWLVGTLAFVAEDAMLNRYRMDVPDNRQVRRIRTQITVVRRITVAVLVICAFAGILMTFPEARGVGASVFASAGLLSIVAGLAAQSSLANFFAGVQLAFTDAIRVDDVVIVLKEWGRIEEITLTYVVVHIWDDRRLILPSTYFTTTPFENWTRRAADLLGTVEIDVDWDVPVEEVRAEMSRLLASTPLWDRRVGVMQVTDATLGYVRLRALASARDAGTLFDLRCFLREGLVEWLRTEAPQSLPRTRTVAVVTMADEGEADEGEADEGEGDVEASAPRGLRRWVPTSRAPAGPAPERAAAPTTAAAKGATAGHAPPGIVGRRSAKVATRARAEQPEPRGSDETQRIDLTSDSSLFTGSIEAIERSRAFSGPGEGVIAEREEHAARDEARRREAAGQHEAGQPEAGQKEAGQEEAGDGEAGEGDGARPEGPAGREEGGDVEGRGEDTRLGEERARAQGLQPRPSKPPVVPPPGRPPRRSALPEQRSLGEGPLGGGSDGPGEGAGDGPGDGPGEGSGGGGEQS